jgi:hypothetical protein
MQHVGLVRSLGVAVSLASLALAGCGDDDNGNGGGTPDAMVTPVADARPPDAMPPVAATHSGTVSVQDVSVFGLAAAGHGGQINISFTKTGVPTEMAVGDFVGTPPCNATLIDVTKTEQANPTTDQGMVTVEIKPMAGGTRPVPPCTFQGSRYLCASGGGTAGTIAAGGAAGLWNFMGTGTTTAVAGQYLLVVGGAGAGLAAPIVGVNGTTLVLAASSALPASVGMWATAAGIGPVPFTLGTGGMEAPPEFIANNDRVKVTLAGGAGVSARATPDIDPGDEFQLADDVVALYGTGIDLDRTTALDISCKKDGAGACPPAIGTIVSIDTTDNPDTGTATTFNPATKYSGNITCANFGDAPVSIPANLFAVLKAGTPTKLRIAVFRAGFSPLMGSGNTPATLANVNVVAGHGIVHFQTGNF